MLAKSSFYAMSSVEHDIVFEDVSAMSPRCGLSPPVERVLFFFRDSLAAEPLLIH
jgi:hypothetical protein